MKPCPNCGQDAPTSDRFCPNCGVLLPWANATTTPTPSATPSSAPQYVQAAPVTPAQPQQAYVPPVAPTPPTQPQPAYAPPVQPQQTYVPPVQPQRQPAVGTTYTAQQPYADPNSYNAPSTPPYVSGGVIGGNLPMPRVQQAPTPVAPTQGADPMMNTLLNLGRSLGAGDTRGLLRIAAIVLVAIVALWVVFQALAWFLSLLPWLLLIVAIVIAWQYRKRRKRLRIRP